MAYTNNDVQALLAELEYNAAQISALNERSRDIRLSLAQEALGDAWNDAHGVQNLEVSGVKLKFDFKQTYSVKVKELASIVDQLSDEGKKAIKYKPELALSVYKNLDVADKVLLNQALTTKPALPVITKK